MFCITLTAADLLLRLILVERRNSPKEWFESSSEEGCDATLQEYTQVNREKGATKEQTRSSLSLTYNIDVEEANRTNQKAEGSILISEDDDSNITARRDDNNKENSNGN